MLKRRAFIVNSCSNSLKQINLVKKTINFKLLYFCLFIFLYSYDLITYAPAREKSDLTKCPVARPKSLFSIQKLRFAKISNGNFRREAGFFKKTINFYCFRNTEIRYLSGIFFEGYEYYRSLTVEAPFFLHIAAIEKPQQNHERIFLDRYRTIPYYNEL